MNPIMYPLLALDGPTLVNLFNHDPNYCMSTLAPAGHILVNLVKKKRRKKKEEEEIRWLLGFTTTRFRKGTGMEE
jgi:hypothetical protein